MNQEWKTMQIGDLVTVKRGASPRPIKDYIDIKGMPWVKISDATADHTRFINMTKEFIKEEGIEKSVVVNKGDLIVSNSATPGLPKIMNIKACIHDGWLYFNDYEKILKEYLYYFFIFMRGKLVNQANGSVFKNLKTDIVKQFDISLPSLDEQKKIVKILENIDKKIELNYEINNNLLNQCKVIYTSWFRNFDPFSNDEFIPSDFGNIPQNWSVGKLGDIVEIYDSKRIPLSNQEREPMDKIYPYYGASSLMDYVDDYIFEGIYLLIGEDGTVIDSENHPILQYVWDKFWVNNHAHIIKGKNGFSTEAIYIMLSKTNVQQSVTGAVQAKINQTNLKNIPVLIPSEDVLKKYNKILESYFKLYRKNSEEIQYLTKLRDTLLPKLMSGEIDVSGINFDLD